jgi:hypothetical protein
MISAADPRPENNAPTGRVAKVELFRQKQQDSLCEPEEKFIEVLLFLHRTVLNLAKWLCYKVFPFTGGSTRACCHRCIYLCFEFVSRSVYYFFGRRLPG